MPTQGPAPVEVDVRGPFTVLVYRDNGTAATCFASPSFVSVTEVRFAPNSVSVSAMEGQQRAKDGSGSGETTSSGWQIGRGGGDLQMVGVNHFQSADGAFTLLEGEASSQVTGVTLVRSDGTGVEASVADGMFVAWWPGDLQPFTAQVTTASGTSGQALQFPPAPFGPGGPTGRSGHFSCAEGNGATTSTVPCPAPGQPGRKPGPVPATTLPPAGAPATTLPSATTTTAS